MNTVDQALRDDIRLLGQLLGAVLRTHEGEALYTKVEDIRRTALQFRREDDPAAARRLDTQLRRLSRDDTITVVRAFSVFSHLANIAEDRHLVRRLAVRRDSRTGLARACDGAAAAARHRHAAARVAAGRRLPDAGADRASDRSAAQKHPRYRARDRRTDRSTRTWTCRRQRSDRRRTAGGDFSAVADADAAIREAERLRRDRQRACVLAHDVLARDAGRLRRGGESCAASATGADLPGARQLDRRGSRRPPARDRRDDAGGAEGPGRNGVRPLRRGGACARRRTVDVAAAHLGQRRTQRARCGKP